MPMAALFKEYKLGPQIAEFVGHAIALHRDDGCGRSASLFIVDVYCLLWMFIGYCGCCTWPHALAVVFVCCLCAPPPRYTDTTGAGRRGYSICREEIVCGQVRLQWLFGLPVCRCIAAPRRQVGLQRSTKSGTAS